MPPIPVSFKERFAGATVPVMGANGQDLRLLIEAMAADIVSLKTQLQGALIKLDADAGVTDTNYAALWGTAGTTYYTSN